MFAVAVIVATVRFLHNRHQVPCPISDLFSALVIPLHLCLRFQVPGGIGCPYALWAQLCIGKVCARHELLCLQLDFRSARHTRKINLPANQKGYDNSETTNEKLSARRIQIYPDYFCLGIILKVIY